MSVVGGKPMHCLSFDVEEHFQVSAFWSEARRQQWDRYESRVENEYEKACRHCWPSMTRKPRFLSLGGWLNDTQVWSRC